MKTQRYSPKLVFFCLCFSLVQCSLAKVAYIPLFDATAQQETHIMAVDLNEGRVLKQVHVGDGVGPVFINELGDQLYAAASLENKIVLINTNTLEITREWLNLPISPQQIILNTDESKLYFAERGLDDIYEIDLMTGIINMALNINNFNEFYYSDNLAYIVFRSHDSVSDTYQLHTYHLNDLSFKYQTVVSDNLPMLVDDSGEEFYYSINFFGRFQSRNLSDNQLNWLQVQEAALMKLINLLATDSKQTT